MTEIEPSTLRILNAKGQTIGTGFLVSKTLAVTCAHVAMAASPDGENRIRAQFTGQKQPIFAKVLDQFLDLDHDVAILELASVPEGIQPLRLGLAAECQSGNPFYSFGYTSAANIQGIIARGAIDGYLPQHQLLQLQAPQANHGISGAPVLEEKRGVVVGMITKGHEQLGRNQETTFATPTEVIFEICPEIQPSEICPYLGLESFSAETERFFFGRTALTEKLLTTLRGGCRFLAVFGPSGSGKSSVVRAGLLPALAKGQLPGSQKWVQVTIRPADDPFAQMKVLGLGLRDIDGYLRRQPGMQRIVLFVDQFEELFTLCPDELRDGFVRDLAAALDDSHLILVISMRDDFYSTFNAKAAPLAGWAYQKVDVPATLERADLVAMIEQPAAAVGLALEEGLTDAIIKDAASDGAARSATLPLLEFALTQLWDKRRDGLLTHDAYQSIGGVTGSLARWAEDAYSDLPKAEQPLAESLLTSLVHLGDEALGLPDTRRRRTLAEFDEPTRRVIKHFADRRLLVTGGETVELVHDALVREWSRLQGWIKSDRDNLRLREGISDATHQWEDGGRDESLLNHRSARLELALAMSKLPEYHLNPSEQAYLNVCVNVREREKRAAETLHRRIIVSLSTGLAIALILAGFSVYQTLQAQDKTRIARAGELAAQAVTARDKNFQTSLLLGIEANKNKDITQSRNALLNNIQTNPQLHTFLNGHTDSVTSVAFSTDGKMLASGSADNTIILSDVATGQDIGRLLAGQHHVNSVVFSPDGKTLASGSCKTTDSNNICLQGEIILWDVENRKDKQHLSITRQPDNDNRVISVAFSPDGKILASGSWDGTIIFWDLATGQPMSKPSRRQFLGLTSVVFSPNGKMLASGGYEGGDIILWDVATGQPIGQPLTGHTDLVSGVAFSPDGNTLAVSDGRYSTITLWNVATGKFISQLPDKNTFGITSIAFSPNGKTLVSGSYNGAIILWDLTTMQPIGDPLKGHAGAVTSVAFSPDGNTLASGSSDKTTILWNMDVSTHVPISQLLTGNFPGQPMAFSLDGKTLALAGSDDQTIYLRDMAMGKPISQLLKLPVYGIYSVAFSQNGKLVASGGCRKRDNSDVLSCLEAQIILWDVATGKPIGQPFVLPGTVQANTLSFSPNGEILASGSYDGTIILWNVATGKPIGQPLTGHTGGVHTLAFSPDGKMLASGSEDQTIILWNIAIGQPIRPPFVGHNSGIFSVVFSPNGKTLASASFDRTIILWNIGTGQPIGQPLMDIDSVADLLAFSPDGEILASGGNAAFLWDVATGQLIGQPLTGYTSGVNTLAFSMDGKTLATAGCAKIDVTTIHGVSEKCIQDEVIIWDINPQSWIEETCQRANRNFTRAEWSKYFTGEEYRATCPQFPLEPEPTPIPSPTP